MRRLAPIVSAVALVGLLAGACGGSGDKSGAGDRSPDRAAPAKTSASQTTASHPKSTRAKPKPKRPRPTTPPGMAPAAYRHALAVADDQVTQALAGIGAAPTVPVLLSRLATTDAALNRAARLLDRLRPPRAAVTANTRLVSALRGFSGDIGALQSAAKSQQICAGSSALSRLHSRSGPNALRQATWALANKGFDSRLKIPALPAQQTRRLGTGTFTQDARAGGNGQLEIDNNGDVDAVVSLVTGGHPIFGVYVTAGASYTVSSIPDGTYEAYFTTGLDWNPPARSFTRSCSFTKYDDTFPYQTTATTLPGWSITLERTIGGNASTTDLDPSQYPR
ncbi:MAG TPA: hypothetical protein VHC49_10765 [Mycobacteriales bacterium]|nr:hypothetical protein [Mycobacteriales bacterium]